MNNCILFMTLCGSIILILYYSNRMCFKNTLSASFYYLMLKIAVFLYIFPLPLFSNKAKDFIRTVLRNQHLFERNYDKVTPVDVNKMLFVTDKGFYIAPTWTLTFRIVISIWLLILFIFLCIHLYQYHTLHRLIKENTLPTEEYDRELRRVRDTLNLRKNVNIRILRQHHTPFLCGMIKPCIILPEGLDNDESSVIIQHELTHVKSHDQFIRAMCILVMAIHFFNPFVYLLFWEITKISELHCDEHVIKKLNDSKRAAQYGHLILNMTHFSVKSPFLSPFVSSDKKIMKERITMIKFPTKNKLHIALPILIISVLSSTTPVLAYDFPEIAEYDQEYVEDISAPGELWREPAGSPIYSEDEELFKQTDSYYLDEDGQLMTRSLSKDIQPQAHSHTIANFTQKKHAKNSSGGCTVREWAVRGCTKCSYTVSKELISTITYEPCPHK